MRPLQIRYKIPSRYRSVVVNGIPQIGAPIFRLSAALTRYPHRHAQNVPALNLHDRIGKKR
jgi:hypothetical protein